MFSEIIFITLGLWIISFISIFKPIYVLRFKDIFRIKGKAEYTDLAIHSVIFGGILIFIVSLVLIYFFITDVYYMV